MAALVMGLLGCVAPTGAPGEGADVTTAMGDLNFEGEATREGASFDLGQGGEIVLGTPSGELAIALEEQDPGERSFGKALVVRLSDGSVARLPIQETSPGSESQGSARQVVLDLAPLRQMHDELTFALAEIGGDAVLASEENTLSGPSFASAGPLASQCDDDVAAALDVELRQDDYCGRAGSDYNAWLWDQSGLGAVASLWQWEYYLTGMCDLPRDFAVVIGAALTALWEQAPCGFLPLIRGLHETASAF